MKIYRLRPDQDSYELHNLGRSGVRLYHDQMYTEHSLRSDLGYRDDYQLQWFDVIGESPPECDAAPTVAALAKLAEALRHWIQTSPVIQEFGWSQANRAGAAPASQPTTVRELVVQRIEQLVDAAVRLGRLERPEVEELDESGALVVLNGLVEWATPPKDPPADDNPQTDDGFSPFKLLWDNDERFDTYRKAKRFLDKHKQEIRHRHPSQQRLEVHAADWASCVTKHFPEPTDTQIDAYIDAAAQRKAKIDKNRKGQDR